MGRHAMRFCLWTAAFAAAVIAGSCSNPLADVVQRDFSATQATPPVVDSFTLATDTTYDGAVSFTIASTHPGASATSITKWLVNELPVAPSADDAGWSDVAAPEGGTYTVNGSYTVGSIGTYGDRTLYAWLKNDKNLVSAPATAAAVTVHYAQYGGPVVDFDLKSSTPTDDPAITFDLSKSTAGVGASSILGWLIKESSTAPAPDDIPSGSAPTGWTLSLSAGDHVVYAYAKNDQNKVGWASVTVNINHRTAHLPGYPFITGHEQLVVTFDVAMGSATLSGSITPKNPPDAGDWATGKKSLTVSPSTSLTPQLWPTAGGELVVNGTTSYGVPIDEARLTYSNIFYGVCVSVDDPNGSDTIDSTCGQVSKPLKSIYWAIYALSDPGSPFYSKYTADRAVRIAAGTYYTNWNAGGTSRITVKNLVSLLGGYSTDWSTRFGANRTIIIDQSSGGSPTADDPHRAIDIPTGINTSTVVEGLAVYGSSSNDAYTAAIVCGENTVIIRKNEIIAGGGIGTRRYGILFYATTSGLDSSVTENLINQGGEGGGSAIVNCYGIRLNSSLNPTIEKNTISGGSADTTTGQSAGIYWSVASTAPTIKCNTISGGTAQYAMCIGIAASSTAQIYNNLLTGGYAPAGSSYCMYLGSAGSSPIIRNNTIALGHPSMSGTAAYGIYQANSTALPTIENNIFLFRTGTGSYSYYGIYEAASIAQVSIKNNDFYSFPNGTYDTIYYDNNSTPVKTIGALNGLSNCAANTDINPQLDSLTFRPTDSTLSPVKDGGLNGATNGFSFTTDVDGDLRTGSGSTGWTMGFDEKD